MRVLPVLCVGGIVLSACGGSSGSALSIKVELSGSSAQCVSAGVRLASGKELETAPTKRGTKTTMVFGVGATGEIKGKVTPFARGWKASACAQIGTAPADETATGGTVDLGQPGVQTVTLALKAPATGDGGFDGGTDAGADAGMDAGPGDGGPTDAGPDGGPGDAGPDAGVDAGCVPAAFENCLNGTDDTCNGLVDCADPGCAAMACAGGGTCAALGDGGTACLQPAETLCNDLTDNDNDLLVDCLDPDCNGRACTDSNLCTTSDFCQGTVCDGGAATVCANALLDCRASSGVCVPATGACSFAPIDGGQPCNDGVACTSGDHCNAGAVCTGTLYACATSQCVDAGTCLGDGGCAFTFASATTACDDGALCTHTDRCDGLGVCSGTGYSCSPPPVCFSGTACLGDGGCAWTFNGVGTPCPTGFCGPDAGCLAPPGFGYAPSNWDPSFVPDASIAPPTAFVGCTVEFDSTANTFVDGGWCGQTKPIPFVFNQDGGISTTVLAMRNFNLAANATLVLFGTRPIILAVYDSANLQGTIDARAVGFTRTGPGGNFSGCNASGDGRDALFSAGGGGAGFGTNGAAGAGTGAGAAGLATANSKLVPLRGGCQGGQGHDDSNRTNAIGGFGGGALQISVAKTLIVGGIIATSGGGGQGGTTGAADNVGGGGGGSGGALLLEAAALDVIAGAKLVSNGGGGGGGRANGSGVIGQPGEDGALADALPALGGAHGTAVSGDGGSGAAGAIGAAPGTPGVGFAGSGGGGAGLGIIRFNAFTTCQISDAGVLISGSSSRSLICP